MKVAIISYGKFHCFELARELLSKNLQVKVYSSYPQFMSQDYGLTGMLHYKEISYEENIEDLKKFKKNDTLNVKVIEIKDDKIRFSKRALDKDPLEWFKDNKKKAGDVITTRIHEVLKTGVKVAGVVGFPDNEILGRLLYPKP